MQVFRALDGPSSLSRSKVMLNQSSTHHVEPIIDPLLLQEQVGFQHGRSTIVPIKCLFHILFGTSFYFTCQVK